MFGRRRNNPVDQPVASNSRTGTRTGSMFSRNGAGGDSLGLARSKVREAEQAEREAEGLLAKARAATKEAHTHVSRVEKEAEEEARMAAAKQKGAKGLRRDANGLGRV